MKNSCLTRLATTLATIPTSDSASAAVMSRTINYCRTLLATILLLASSLTTHAQTGSPVVADTARVVFPASLITPVNLQNYEAFRAAVQPLIRQMATKKIVAMGEGTHGTAEFYKARFWLTRILVEEHGFDQLALENTYGDTYQLNEALRGRATDFQPLMRETLLSIWQNQEMSEVFAWIQAHNRTHRRKVTVAGIDAMFSGADAELLQKGLAATGRTDLLTLVAQVRQSGQYKDSVWYQLSDSTHKFDRKKMLVKALAGYDAADKLLKALPAVKLPRQQRALLIKAATNARMTFDDYYQVKVNKRESSRDSAMAEMARLLTQKTRQRLIIWAHNAHVARHGVLPGDDNGGGTGAFLERMFPNQYFVLATVTATGTFAATTQNFVSPISPMAAYPLPLPKSGSWDAILSQVNNPDFYFFTEQLGAHDTLRPLRLKGYTVGRADFYADIELAKAFDAVLFLRQTTAATPLPQ